MHDRVGIWSSRDQNSRSSYGYDPLELFYQSTPSCLKVIGWWGGGPCDFSVSPSPFGLDFGTLDFGLGLDNSLKREHFGRNHQEYFVENLII